MPGAWAFPLIDVQRPWRSILRAPSVCICSDIKNRDTLPYWAVARGSPSVTLSRPKGSSRNHRSMVIAVYFYEFFIAFVVG